MDAVMELVDMLDAMAVLLTIIASPKLNRTLKVKIHPRTHKPLLARILVKALVKLLARVL